MRQFVIPSLSSIESYIRAVNSFPILTLEEEQSLAIRLKESNDLTAAHALIVSHLRVVVSIVRGYSGYKLPTEDLIQEGNIGLMKAVKKFDPDRGVRLVSLAYVWIKAQINEYVIRNWRQVKIAYTKDQRKLFFNLRSLRQDLHTLNQSQVKEIASQLKVSEKDVVEMEARFANTEMHLDQSYDDEDDLQIEIADESAEPLKLLEYSEHEHKLSNGMETGLAELDSRSRFIIEARWMSDEKATLFDLSQKLNISQERVRQIEAKALDKLKKAMT